MSFGEVLDTDAVPLLGFAIRYHCVLSEKGPIAFLAGGDSVFCILLLIYSQREFCGEMKAGSEKFLDVSK